MWSWLRRWWRGYVSQDPAQLSFWVSSEERELVEFWAHRNGTTVQEWLRDTVARAIPTVERRKFEARYRLGQTLEAAERASEETSYTPLVPRPEVPEEASEPSVEHLPKDHTCRFLDDERFPRRHDASSCFGTCDHRLQRGRPCFWPSLTAHECEYFRLAKRKDQP